MLIIVMSSKYWILLSSIEAVDFFIESGPELYPAPPRGRYDGAS